MKLSKIAVASTLALIATSAFAADVTIRITGSTAFRASTNQAVFNAMPGAKIGYVGSSLQGSGQMTALGNMTIGGVSKSVLVQCSYSGSEAGIKAVASTTAAPITNWITEAKVAGLAAGANAITLVAGDTESGLANVAMADNAQSETNQKGTGYNTLTAVKVGVVPFVWVKGTHADATTQAALDTVTNITPMQIQLALTGGAPLSIWSKNQADAGTNLVVFGRDILSGTRCDMMLDTYAGAKGAVSNTITQFKAIPSGTTGTITGYGDGTTDGNPLPNTDGYTSGGTMMGEVARKVDASRTDFAVISYAGFSDAKSLPGISLNTTTGVFTFTPGANTGATSPILSYNGVPFSFDAVRSGQYQLWNYEYLMYGAAINGNATAKTAVTNIANEIKNTTASISGIKNDTSFHATRSGGGQIIVTQ